MFCPKCGKEVADGSAFCNHCGTPFAAQQVTAVPAGAKPRPEMSRGFKIFLLLVSPIAVVAVSIFTYWLLYGDRDEGSSGAETIVEKVIPFEPPLHVQTREAIRPFHAKGEQVLKVSSISTEPISCFLIRDGESSGCTFVLQPGETREFGFFELKKAFVVGETAYIAVGGCRKDLKIRFREDAYEANWVSKKYKYP